MEFLTGAAAASASTSTTTRARTKARRTTTTSSTRHEGSRRVAARRRRGRRARARRRHRSHAAGRRSRSRTSSATRRSRSRPFWITGRTRTVTERRRAVRSVAVAPGVTPSTRDRDAMRDLARRRADPELELAGLDHPVVGGRRPRTRTRADRARASPRPAAPGSSHSLANAFSSCGGRATDALRVVHVALHDLGAAPRRPCCAPARRCEPLAVAQLRRRRARASTPRRVERERRVREPVTEAEPRLDARARRTSGSRRTRPRRSAPGRARRDSS